ncbi:MAG: hypothetical protein GY838_01945 [bacterium]|nr:hypothetical protein [bacterium]
MPSRIHAIGYLRPTVLLVGAITGLIFLSQESRRIKDRSQTSKLLIILAAYVVVVIPMVEWPGSAVNRGIEGFVKAIVFFFFPLYLVDSYGRLRKFIFVVVFCQVFRVLEPLYLHLATGYWGSQAHMGGAEFLDRLSGAPHDLINPNGLAFVIMTVLPFLHYLFGGDRRFLFKASYFALLPCMLYTLLLTGSRSGMVGLVVIYGFVFLRSRHKFVLVLGVVLAACLMVAAMNDDQRDRYLSLVSSDTKNSGTREGRITGVVEEIEVGMRRPLFGHGIGTSWEANANFRGVPQVSHNLYTEVFIELGAFGLVIFMGVLVSILRNVLAVKPAVRRILKLAREVGLGSAALRTRLMYYHQCAEAVFVLSGMCIVFSLASYGLSEFYWYLTAGMSVSILNITGVDYMRIVRMREVVAQSEQAR